MKQLPYKKLLILSLVLSIIAALPFLFLGENGCLGICITFPLPLTILLYFIPTYIVLGLVEFLLLKVDVAIISRVVGAWFLFTVLLSLFFVVLNLTSLPLFLINSIVLICTVTSGVGLVLFRKWGVYASLSMVTIAILFLMQNFVASVQLGHFLFGAATFFWDTVVVGINIVVWNRFYTLRNKFK